MILQEVLEYKSFEDIPFKIELNAQGVIEMSLGTNRHIVTSRNCLVVWCGFQRLGNTITEISILLAQPSMPKALQNIGGL